MNDRAEIHDPTLDPWGDHAAAESAERAETDARHDAIEGDRFWLSVLADRRGRRELWKLIADDLHAFQDRFMCGPTGFPDAQATWFAAGAQAAGLRIYQRMLLRDPAAVAAMHAENDGRFAPRPAAAPQPEQGES